VRQNKLSSKGVLFREAVKDLETLIWEVGMTTERHNYKDPSAKAFALSSGAVMCRRWPTGCVIQGRSHRPGLR
jgi:hypothetical protein